MAGIAHEINNPVNFISGNLTYINEYTQDFLSLIKLYPQEHPEPNLLIQERIKSLELDFFQKDILKFLKFLKIGSDPIRKIVISLRKFSRLSESDMKRLTCMKELKALYQFYKVA